MSLEQVKEQIDKVARSSGFRCRPVSWEDCSRGTVGGALSCWGGNISDVRLWAKSGKLLYTVRSENWNERVGYIAARDVAVVVGNHVAGGFQLSNITLQSYLDNAKQYGSYAGLASASLSAKQVDQIFSIRFQTVFLPVEGDDSPNAEDIPPEKLGRVEFCSDVYNYNTHSDENPRNILLLCTAQGTSMQHDGAGTKKMFLHEVDPSGNIHRYWLESERSKHGVGGSQKESKDEAKAAAARGKAVATFIGIKEMGTRFNVQMLIQIPIKQSAKRRNRQTRRREMIHDTLVGSSLSSGSDSFISSDIVKGSSFSAGSTSSISRDKIARDTFAIPEPTGRPMRRAYTLDSMESVGSCFSAGNSSSISRDRIARDILAIPEPTGRPIRRAYPLDSMERVGSCSSAGSSSSISRDKIARDILAIPEPTGRPIRRAYLLDSMEVKGSSFSAVSNSSIARDKIARDIFANPEPTSRPRQRASPVGSCGFSCDDSFTFRRNRVGTSNAARVSRSSEEDTWAGLTKKNLERDDSQHGTITVTMYYTVVGGIPSEADVLAAVQDLNELYQSCSSDKRLVECTAITRELTVKNVSDIKTKLLTQGYQPPVKTVNMAADAFPY